MTAPVTIPRGVRRETLDDFDALKQEAIDWLAQSCGEQWTEFNAPDPGVQILEELCFALTELGYRASFPIDSILANPTGEIDWEAGAFFPPPDIFPMSPLTAKDYRKLILDRFPEVVNLWVEAVHPDAPEGGLNVWVAVDPDLPETAKSAVRDAVARRLARRRNLGEYWAEVKLAPEVAYWLTGTIEPEGGAGLASVTADLFLAVRRATAERPSVYTKEARLAAGQSLSEILTGPLLHHGVLLDADLREPRGWGEVRERAMAALLDFDGGRVTGDLQLGVDDPAKLDPHAFLVFHLHDPRGPVDPEVQRLIDAREREEKAKAAPSARLLRATGWSMPKPDPALPVGLLEHYRSIQHGFPPNYALRSTEAPLHGPAQRLAQIKQLKGYLLFFEQIMANFLAQLGHTGALLSWRPHALTYFRQPIYDVPGVAPLLKGFNEGERPLSPAEAAEWRDAYCQNPVNAYQRGLQALAESSGETCRRRGRFLDHLLARFGETYPQTDDVTYETIYNRSKLLREYPGLGRHRATGSGLEAKLACLLPRNEQEWPAMSQGAGGEKWYYLLEPGALNRHVTQPGWRFTLTHVLFNWTVNPLTADFKEYVRNIVIENSGAHLAHRFWWFDWDQTGAQPPDFRESDFREFAALHRQWSEAGSPCIQADGANPPESATALCQWVFRRLPPPPAS